MAKFQCIVYCITREAVTEVEAKSHADAMVQVEDNAINGELEFKKSDMNMIIFTNNLALPIDTEEVKEGYRKTQAKPTKKVKKG